jgi:hypothetical protein
MLKLVEKRNPDPVFAASSFVALTQLIHVFFILTLFKKLFDIGIPAFSNVYFFNKLFFMPFVIIWLVFVYRYFKKHSDEIIKLYAGKKTLTLKNAIIVFSSILLPLISMIQLLKK